MRDPPFVSSWELSQSPRGVLANGGFGVACSNCLVSFAPRAAGALLERRAIDGVATYLCRDSIACRLRRARRQRPAPVSSILSA